MAGTPIANSTKAILSGHSALRARLGLRTVVMPHGSDGRVKPEEIAVPKGACLAVVSHQSNVNGVVQPLAAIKVRLGEVPLLVDAAQSAGEIPLDAERGGVDVLVNNAAVLRNSLFALMPESSWDEVLDTSLGGFRAAPPPRAKRARGRLAGLADRGPVQPSVAEPLRLRPQLPAAVHRPDRAPGVR